MQVQKDDLRCLRILTYRHLIQYSKHKFRLLYLTYIDLGSNLQDPFIRYWSSIQFHAKSLQSCQTLCDPMDYSLPGSLPMGFSRQEYWSGFAMPSSGDLPNQGIELASTVAPALQAESSPLSYQGNPTPGYSPWDSKSQTPLMWLSMQAFL